MLLDISPIESVHIFEGAFSREFANQRAPYAEIYGDSAAIHGFRNFPNDFRALILRNFSGVHSIIWFYRSMKSEIETGSGPVTQNQLPMPPAWASWRQSLVKYRLTTGRKS